MEYLNDLPGTISSSVELFADDTKLDRTKRCEEDKLILQEDILNATIWSKNSRYSSIRKNANL